MKQVSDALKAMRLRRSGDAPAVMARKEPIAANGSTRKKIELTASSENRTYVEFCSSCSAVLAGPYISTEVTLSSPRLPASMQGPGKPIKSIHLLQ